MSATFADLSQRGRPDTTEQIPYFRAYIDLVPEGDVLDILDKQIGPTLGFFAGLSAEDAQWRPAPGEWNALEIVGHLVDIERLMTYRAMHVARGDTSPWGDVDVELYVDNADFAARTLPDLAAEFAAVRAATLAFLRGLGPVAWDRRSPEDGFTIRSVRSFAYVIAGHELHHLESLQSQRG